MLYATDFIKATLAPSYCQALQFRSLQSGHPPHIARLQLILLSPEGWNPENRLSAPGYEPGPTAHMSEDASERPTTSPTELARRTNARMEADVSWSS